MKRKVFTEEQHPCKRIMPHVVGLTFYNESKPEGQQVSVGSGTIINPQRLILTANNVLKDGRSGLMSTEDFIVPESR